MKSRQSFLSSAAYFCNLTNPRDKKNIWKLSKCRVKTRCVLKNSLLSHSNVNFPGDWNHETHRPLPSLALSLTLQTNNVQQQKLKSKWQKKLSSSNPAGREETEIVWWLYAVVILSLSLSLFSSCFFFYFYSRNKANLWRWNMWDLDLRKQQRRRCGLMSCGQMSGRLLQLSSFCYISHKVFWCIGKKPQTSELLMRRWFWF